MNSSLSQQMWKNILWFYTRLRLSSLDVLSFMCVRGPVTTHHNLSCETMKNNDMKDKTVTILGYFESPET